MPKNLCLQSASLSWEDLLEEEWQPTAVFLPGESHGQRSLAAYSPRSQKELDMTKWVTLTISPLLFIVQSLTCVQLFVTPWTVAHQASLSITNSWSLLKLISIELVMPPNHLILCHSLFLLPSISQHQGLFQWGSSLHQVAKILELQLQHQSFQWVFRVDFL